MRVLLVGEYSGFFTNLKKGLIKNGVDCVLASNMDVWKKISGTDILLYNDAPVSGWKKIWNLIFDPIVNRKRFFDFDIVQFVNPIVFPKAINSLMFWMIKRKCKKIFVSIAGDGYSVYNAYREGLLDYYIYDDNPGLVSKYTDQTKGCKKRIKCEEYVLSHVNGIIPIMYEYAVGVRSRVNTQKTIPIPFDVSEIEYVPNVVNGKIVIFHGIIREEAKGSSYIKEALKIIKDRYPNDVEVIIDGKMPLDKYLQFLKGINILVDQCKEHCYGMNALYAMAEGRIVLGGASDNSLKELGISSCPVIHIEPDVNVIVKQIEELLSKKDQFLKMGEESRRFVEEIHDSKQIAKMYIDTWNEN